MTHTHVYTHVQLMKRQTDGWKGREDEREGGSRHDEEFACADEVGQQLLGLGRRQPVKQENPEHPVQVGNLSHVLVRVVDDLREERISINIGATYVVGKTCLVNLVLTRTLVNPFLTRTLVNLILTRDFSHYNIS